MSNQEDEYTHESYGAITINRTSCHPSRRLFGSDINESTVITLRIHESQLRRNLLQSWHHPRREIIEVGLSQHQFGRLLCSMSIGEGVPCTILRRNGKGVAEPPDRKDIDLTLDEAKRELHELRDEIESKITRVEEILSKKGAPRKAEKSEILSAFKSLSRIVGGKFDFMQDQLETAFDRMENQALASAGGLLERELGRRGLSIEPPDLKYLTESENNS